jgi:hypothetical protein
MIGWTKLYNYGMKTKLFSCGDYRYIYGPMCVWMYGCMYCTFEGP